MPLPVFDDLRFTARVAMDYTNLWFDNPHRAANLFMKEMALEGFGMADPPTEIKHSMFCSALICGRWAMSGYPTVTMGHRAASHFMATKIRPADAVEFVRCPWPAFVIRLPDDLLYVEDHGVMRSCSVLAVTALEASEVIEHEPVRGPSDQQRWWFKLIAPNALPRLPRMTDAAVAFLGGMSLWGFNFPTELLATPDAEAQGEGFERWDTQVRMDSDARSDQLARALITSCCLHLSGDPRERAGREAAVSVMPPKKSKQRLGDPLPLYTQYEIRSSIKINLHHAMREYVVHGGSSPVVRTMAAGHWKRVAHGPEHSLRRLQHIEPYWRGPLDAPISTRIK